MLIQEKDQIVELLKQLDIETLEKTMLSLQPDNDIEVYNDYSVNRIVLILRRSKFQIETEILEESRLGTLLPVYFLDQNGTLVSIIDTLAQLVQQQTNGIIWSKIVPLTQQLVNYQIINGFWDRGNTNIYNANEVNVKEIKDKIKQALNDTDKITSEVNNLLVLKEKASNTVQSILDKLEEASNIVENSNLRYSEVELIKSKITEIETSLKNENTETKSLILTQRDETSKHLLKIRNHLINFETLENKQKLLNSEAEKLIQLLLSYEKELDEKRIIVDKLVGQSADAGLGTRFDTRATALKQATNNWLYIMLVFVIVAICYIYMILSKFPSNYHEDWLNLVSYSLKFIPLGVLANFIITQYNKNRNLEEEYAFKAAIAFTTSSYTKLIGEKFSDEDGKSERYNFLISTVQKLYNKPQIYKNNPKEVSGNENNEYSSIIEKLISVLNNYQKSNGGL